MHWSSGWTWVYISLHALQWIKSVRMSLSPRVRKGRQSQKDVNMWICRETSTHGKSLLCQISGCTSIQSLDCPDLITPLLAKGSLTERFLTLKSNPSQIRRWLNLIYVGFMRRTVPRHHCIPLNTGQEPLVCNLEIFNVSIIWKKSYGTGLNATKGRVESMKWENCWEKLQNQRHWPETVNDLWRDSETSFWTGSPPREPGTPPSSERTASGSWNWDNKAAGFASASRI